MTVSLPAQAKQGLPPLSSAVPDPEPEQQPAAAAPARPTPPVRKTRDNPCVKPFFGFCVGFVCAQRR